MYEISWEDFDQDFGVTESGDQAGRQVNEEPLPDGDCIWLTEAPAAGADSIEIVFKLGPRVSWWKEVKAIDHNGNLVNRIARDGRHRGPLSFAVAAADVERLVFGKAKLFGWHTEMYAVGDALKKKGRHLTCSWDTD